MSDEREHDQPPMTEDSAALDVSPELPPDSVILPPEEIEAPKLVPSLPPVPEPKQLRQTLTHDGNGFEIHTWTCPDCGFGNSTRALGDNRCRCGHKVTLDPLPK